VYRKATDFYKLIFVSCYIAEAVYLIFVPYSPSYTLSVYPPPSHWYQHPQIRMEIGTLAVGDLCIVVEMAFLSLFYI
jgi:hypothetical protein